MFRDHPLYLAAAILFAAGIQWLILRKLRGGLKQRTPHPPEE